MALQTLMIVLYAVALVPPKAPASGRLEDARATAHSVANPSATRRTAPAFNGRKVDRLLGSAYQKMQSSRAAQQDAVTQVAVGGTTG